MKSIRVVPALKEETVSMDLNDLSAKANIRRGTLLKDQEREKIEETVSQLRNSVDSTPKAQ